MEVPSANNVEQLSQLFGNGWDNRSTVGERLGNLYGDLYGVFSLWMSRGMFRLFIESVFVPVFGENMQFTP
jgi:hypothetical protein